MVDNISGWWYTNPPEKYESQIGSSSQLLGKKIIPNHQPANDKAFFNTMCIVSPRNLVTKKTNLNSSNDVEHPDFLPWLLRVCLIRGMGLVRPLRWGNSDNPLDFFWIPGYPVAYCFSRHVLQGGAPVRNRVQLVNITPISLWLMVDISIITYYRL